MVRVPLLPSAAAFASFATRPLRSVLDAHARGHTLACVLRRDAARSLSAAYLAAARAYATGGGIPPHSIVTMPALSPTMERGNIGKWKKSVGDKISPGDLLVEVETDKAQMDFEFNEDEGYIASILMPEGSRDVPVGTPIMVLAEDASDVAALANYKPSGAAGGAAGGAPAPATAPATAPAAAPAAAVPAAAAAAATASTTQVTQHRSRTIASPAARVLAAQKGIDISQVSGSGPGGRIVISDVQNAAALQPQKSASAAQQTPSRAQPPAAKAASYESVPVTTMRRVIAERLTLSKTTIPHYGVTSAVRMDRLLHLRKLLNEKNPDTKLSVTDFLVKAAALAMRAAPHVNGSWQGDAIHVFHDVDVCVAVATPTGLLTPAVRAAQSRGLASISRDAKELAARAKRGALAPADLTGTFTISNLGMYGCVDSFGAIINPPQAAILAVAGVEEIVVRGSEPGSFETAQQMRVTLSCDHRVVDGAIAAEWLREFKRLVEEPLNLMM